MTQISNVVVDNSVSNAYEAQYYQQDLATVNEDLSSITGKSKGTGHVQDKKARNKRK